MGPTEPDGCGGGGPWTGRPADTARLRLRPLTEADIPAIVTLLDDWEVARTTSNIPFPYDRQAADGFIREVGRLQAERKALVFAIEERLTSELVGCVGVSLEDGAGEVGYWIGRSRWGRGYASEALRRLIALAFSIEGVEALTASVLPENESSLRVAETCGLRRMGKRRAELPARRSVAELVLLKLTKTNWLAQRAARDHLLVVAAALIDADGRVLLAKRPEGKSMAGFWEFPGGKVAPGENCEAALVRELDEELGLKIAQSCLAPLFFASHDYDRFQLLMPLFAIRNWQGSPTAREGQSLAWVRPERLGDYLMPPADIPLVALLRDWL